MYYINEISYTRNQNVQYKDAQNFITKTISRLEWDREEGVVMDLGCGPGNSTLQLFLPFFPKLTKLVAVDLLPNMIDFAKRNHSHPKIEYEVANIEDRDTAERWNKSISKLVSIHCIHWLGNQNQGFQNIYEVLKEGGEAALCFTLKSPVWDIIRGAVDDQKWSTYLKGKKLYIPDSQYRENNFIYYKEMLEEIGFTIILYEEHKAMRTFQSDQKCKETIAAVCVVLSSIPVELQEDFKYYIFQQHLSVQGRNKEGELHHTNLNVWLIIKKEKKSEYSL